MALSLAVTPLSFAGASLKAAPTQRAAVRMETVSDLEAMADAQKIPMGCALCLAVKRVRLFRV